MSKRYETLTEEEQQDLLQKYDPEAGTRKLIGIVGWIAFFGLLAFSLFQVYTSVFGVLTAQLQRSIHLGFALALIFLLFPARKKDRGKNHRVAPYDLILAAVSVAVGAYWPLFIHELVNRVGRLTDTDFIIGLLAILLVLEATRRTVGLPIMVIAILFIIYAIFGPYMPGSLAHRGLELDRLIQTMFYTTEGILGTPLGVSSTFIFLFLLFGSFLIKTGVGGYFNDLALLVAGRRVGGPAKVAIFSSALQGTISGSSVANVVTSGAFTIPMMKNLGYRKEFAGAVEASSSTGGQLMPPIMGAAAFLMAEFIGIPYAEIALAAAIPAILYFSGVWIVTHFEAKKTGLRGLSKEEMPDRKMVLKKLYLLIPILSIILLLMTGMSVMLAALYSIVISIVVSAFGKDTRMSFRDIIDALVDGARTALGVAAATACAGIIVGVVTKTGLGLKLANGLLDVADGALLPTLFLTMIASLILGMGSPTTANYVITSTIAAPAIIMLGVPDLSAHLFVFYFGIIADITPPVALAAFSAAAISGGEPIKTGVDSTKLAIAAFIIPYMFVYSPELLLIDTTWYSVLWMFLTAMFGMIAVGAGVVGYWYRRISWIERIFAVVSGLLLIYPEGFSDVIGLVIFAGLIAYQIIVKNHNNPKAQVSG